ncbi:hypothetical protein BOTBODRAFT_182347, partial [Botryobasidium botryosum FD-172 SS1]
TAPPAKRPSSPPVSVHSSSPSPPPSRATSPSEPDEDAPRKRARLDPPEEAPASPEEIKDSQDQQDLEDPEDRRARSSDPGARFRKPYAYPNFLFMDWDDIEEAVVEAYDHMHAAMTCLDTPARHYRGSSHPMNAFSHLQMALWHLQASEPKSTGRRHLPQKGPPAPWGPIDPWDGMRSADAEGETESEEEMEGGEETEGEVEMLVG